MTKWLIVDDDAEDQEIFEIALHEAAPGIELLRAENGAQAISLLRASAAGDLPELIFLDLNMRQMDGRECMAELQKEKTLKEIPVMIYSTSSDGREMDELLRLGAKRFITKPSNMPELIGILKEVANP